MDRAFFLALAGDLVYTMNSGCLCNHRAGGDLVSTGSVAATCHSRLIERPRKKSINN